MENFILWSPSYAKSEQELSFFSTWVQVQRIKNGTKAMVVEMLEDLDIGTISLELWSIQHFVTDYLTDNPESGDWWNKWMHTVEVKVHLQKPIKLTLTDNMPLIRSYAKDDTWDGKFFPPLPIECVIVADFYSLENLIEAQKLLGKMNQLPDKESLEHESQLQRTIEQKELLRKVRSSHLGEELVKGKPAPRIDTYIREGNPLQLIVSLGNFDEQFFHSGAELAVLIEDICHKFGATTSWNEKRIVP